MTKKRIIIFHLLCLIFIVGLTCLIIFLCRKHFDSGFITEIIISIAIELIIFSIELSHSLIMKIIEDISNNRDYIYLKKYNKETIRLSFSYLIRIKVNNKYLLVLSGHKRNSFGPIGGVYHIKYNDYVYNKLGFSRDSSPGDPEDVRGTIVGKNIKKFIKWFNKKKDREVSPEREFNEEFLSSKLIDKTAFKEQSFKFICTKYKGISFGHHYGCNELLRFDIYELILNNEQIKLLSNLNKKNQELCLFTKEEIKTLGVTKDNDKGIIGTQTPFILED